MMPKRMRKKDVIRMHKASDICDIDTSIVGLFANQLSDVAEKLSIYGVAKPLVICNDTPRSIEKMKNIAICLLLKSLKASRPRRCARLFFSSLLLRGHSGSVKLYRPRSMPRTLHTTSCMYVCCAVSSKPNETLFTSHIDAMKPTVPRVRIGGNALTKLRPARVSVPKATVLERAIVGM